MLAYTNHMQAMPLTGSRLYAVVTLGPDGVGRANDKPRPDYSGPGNLPTSEWPYYLRQREATLVEQNTSVDHSATRQTVSEPGSQSGDNNSLSRDWGEILSGRRTPLVRSNRRRRVVSAGPSSTPLHGDSRADRPTMTTDAKQRRVILGNVPKYHQDDDGNSGLQVLPFPGMLIQAFAAVDLDPDLVETTPTRARSPRAATSSEKFGVSRAKHAGSFAGAKLPKMSGLKRPLAARLRLAPGETARVSPRDRKSVIGAKPNLKYCASAADRNTAVVSNGVYRASRKSEKHKLEVSDSKGGIFKGRTQKQRQKWQQTPPKREQNRISTFMSKSVKRTSPLTGGRFGVSLVADLNKNHETHAHAHASSLPCINEVTMIKSALKRADRPAAPRKSVQFGAEYIREVTKIEYISDAYDDDDETSTTATELSDFSTESVTTRSDDSEENDGIDDRLW
ncbi:hypothetical protein LSAT2_004775, partial [Lamellibrachia satsuma]